jgi:hypothetical protein
MNNKMEVKCQNCTGMDAYVNRLVQNIELSVKDEGLSLLNIVSVCIDLMRIAETFSEVPGFKKKEIVIQAITLFVQKNNGDDTIIVMLPSFIDAAIALEKGNTKIAVAQVASGCCLGFLASNKKNKTTAL